MPEFYGMKYPFKKCARPVLLKKEGCKDCSVAQFCEAEEKEMGEMTKPVKISFISRAGLKVRKPIGKLTKPIKIAFLSNPDLKARDKSVE